MNLIELFRGTSEERTAIAITHELNSRDRRLTPVARRKLTDAQQVSRRFFLRQTALTVTGGLMALGAVGTAGIVTVVGRNGKSDDEYLAEELVRLGVRENPEERRLWSETDITRYSPLVLASGMVSVDQLMSEAELKVGRVLDLMPKSANPAVVEAARFIRKHQDTSDLEVSVRPEIFTPDGQQLKFFMGVEHHVINDRMTWAITPTLPVVLCDSPIGLALQFVHESEHIRDFMEEYENTPSSISIEDRYTLLKSRIRAKWSYKEARAYGAQSGARTYQYGLVRDRKEIDRTQIEFIKAGNDVRNNNWVRYIEDTYISRLKG